jgi:hypothetical protein
VIDVRCRTIAIAGRWRADAQQAQRSNVRASIARSYLTFGDIEGKLDMLRIECTRCDRKGRYSVAKLIARHGRRGTMMKVERAAQRRLSEAGCAHLSERCDLLCRDLPKVL